MMRYLIVGVVIVLFLIFFGPSLMAYGRNMARQLRAAWSEQEPTDHADDVVAIEEVHDGQDDAGAGSLDAGAASESGEERQS